MQEHDVVNRFHIWGTIRSYVVCNHFWELLFLYGLEWLLILKFLFNKNRKKRDKILLSMLLMISVIGIVQFPLTFIGNGFADNTKQLYIFRLTYDITVITGIYILLPIIKSFFDKLGYCYANKISLRKGFMKRKEDINITGGFSNES